MLNNVFPSSWTEEEKALYARWTSGQDLTEAEGETVFAAMREKGKPTVEAVASGTRVAEGGPADPYDALNRHKG